MAIAGRPLLGTVHIKNAITHFPMTTHMSGHLLEWRTDTARSVGGLSGDEAQLIFCISVYTNTPVRDQKYNLWNRGYCSSHSGIEECHIQCASLDSAAYMAL